MKQEKTVLLLGFSHSAFRSYFLGLFA